MTNYRAILLYYTRGNTNTQIATIIECSRTTVIKTIKRAKELNLQLPVPDSISDQELFLMLYPKKGRKTEYFYPDFRALDKDRIKRSFSKFRAWLKYCRVCQRDGLKAYGKSRFYRLYYLFYHKPFIRPKLSKNLSQIRVWEMVANNLLWKSGPDSEVFAEFEYDREVWCRKRRLDKAKVWLY